jgi:hypothetical protein
MEMQQIVQMLAKLQASQNDNQARMEAKMDSDQKKAEADKEEMLARMKEEMKANQENLLATMDHQTKYLLSHINQSMQNLPETEKIHPRMRPSVGEHHYITTEDVAVMPVGELRKRRWVRKLAVERRQNIKDRTRGNHESKRKLPAACRMVSRRAWRKGNTFRRLQNQGKYWIAKEIAAARRGMTQHAEMARRREQGHKRYDQDCVAPGSPEGRTSRIRRWTGP